MDHDNSILAAGGSRQDKEILGQSINFLFVNHMIVTAIGKSDPKKIPSLGTTDDADLAFIITS